MRVEVAALTRFFILFLQRYLKYYITRKYGPFLKMQNFISPYSKTLSDFLFCLVFHKSKQVTNSRLRVLLATGGSVPRLI